MFLTIIISGSCLIRFFVWLWSCSARICCVILSVSLQLLLFYLLWFLKKVLEICCIIDRFVEPFSVCLGEWLAHIFIFSSFTTGSMSDMCTCVYLNRSVLGILPNVLYQSNLKKLPTSTTLSHIPKSGKISIVSE